MSRSSADKRDVYYRLCKSEGYRARSAYKLLHLDEEFDIFRGVEVACDFCAAPGSWSQVLSRKLHGRSKSDPTQPARPHAKIVSIDLQPMAPLPGITTLMGDITLPSTLRVMLRAMGEDEVKGGLDSQGKQVEGGRGKEVVGRKADLIVCDGAPEITGVHDLDGYLHGQLLLAALTLALPLLRPHGTLILKIFLSPLDPTGSLLVSQFAPFFSAPSLAPDAHPSAPKIQHDADAAQGRCRTPGYDLHGRPGGVWVRKPRSSRAGSAEHFLVCRNFDPEGLPVSFDPDRMDPSHRSLSLRSFGWREDLTEEEVASEGMKRWKRSLGWAAGGDLSAWDEESSPPA